MRRVCEPMRVVVTGSHGHEYRFTNLNPSKTRTRDTGSTGLQVLLFATECTIIQIILF